VGGEFSRSRECGPITESAAAAGPKRRPGFFKIDRPHTNANTNGCKGKFVRDGPTLLHQAAAGSSLEKPQQPARFQSEAGKKRAARSITREVSARRPARRRLSPSSLATTTGPRFEEISRLVADAHWPKRRSILDGHLFSIWTLSAPSPARHEPEACSPHRPACSDGGASRPLAACAMRRLTSLRGRPHLGGSLISLPGRATTSRAAPADSAQLHAE
jgi:hypothetical protein